MLPLKGLMRMDRNERMILIKQIEEKRKSRLLTHKTGDQRGMRPFLRLCVESTLT
jgi:hypothetical protein